MTPERWHQVCTIFAAAVRCGPDERVVLLDRACAEDSELRAAVERLLTDDAAAGADRFLTAPSATVTPPRPMTEGPGSTIGPYRIQQQLGEGGMGVVYLAEQQTPVRRKVALKIIKPGMDTAQVIARFEAERQALAMMDHPNIARVYDGGATGDVEGGGWRVEGKEENEAFSPATRHAPPATPSGRPYFVMELVKGVPITEYCDTNRLTPRERLELFLPVCQAIQHAHQKGIIHRDIKPSNLLVTLSDGQPTVKVIDFGVAKAIDQRLTEKTIFTQFGQIVGTLEYMSPEQAEMGTLDVDTRTDIYALGVVLYELLAGSTPLRRACLREAGYGQILRRIREEETPKPSTRLDESDAALVTISAQRRTEPARLARLLRGELDWIVMKALEKDRTRRYETAAGLGHDLRRYLEGDPVEAGPPSAAYRLRKFGQKHRAALATAAAFAGLLVLAAASASYLAVQARRAERSALAAEAATGTERDRAIAAEAKATAHLAKAQDEEKKAKQSEIEAKAVLEFFQDKVLAAARPKDQEGGLGQDVTVRAAVDAAESKIAEAFRDQPAVEASIRHTLGFSYHFLGEPALAIRQFERALALRRQILGPDHPDTLYTMNNLASAYQAAGRLGEALPLHQQTFELHKAKLGPDHLDTLTSMISLAATYQAAGRMSEALPLFEEALSELKAKLGPDHPDVFYPMCHLASAYQAAGRHGEALPLHEQALKLAKAKLGPDHPDTLMLMNNLAQAYQADGRPDEALVLSEAALKGHKDKLGSDHPGTLSIMNNLAAAYLIAKQWAEAEAAARECLGLRRKKQPDEWPRFHTMSQLGAALVGQKRYAEAEPLLLEGYDGLRAREAKIPADRRNYLAEAAARIVPFYEAWGKKDKAAEWRATLTKGGNNRATK
jgi:serine/threonine protein kinase